MSIFGNKNTKGGSGVSAFLRYKYVVGGADAPRKKGWEPLF